MRWVPLFAPDDSRPARGEFRLTTFDVGQGAAVLVETHTHRLIFDTGPRYGDDADAGRAILVPALSAAGIQRLDRLVVSHADANHAGGIASVVRAVNIDSVRASLPDDHPLWTNRPPSFKRCRAGETWEWGAVRFTMLWPDAAMQRRGEVRNPGSCVLHIANARLAALLPGDIEAVKERALVGANRASLRADLLLVPHHGSRTSSTEGFLDAVAPREAVFQVRYCNRFGHPHPGVLARYAARDVGIHLSDRDGVVRANSTAQGFVVERCRESRRRYWMGR